MSLFKQAVFEVEHSLKHLFKKSPKHEHYFNYMKHPERVISFPVSWEDDEGKQHVNKGYRVQFNSALGPYKGGLRFHPTVTEDTVKFLGFEQIFKNALTGINMGGAKGGSDFDPKGKSENEIRRFSQSFMRQLYPYIGPETDVPAGDIGVGHNEIQYMYGEYVRINKRHCGALTGKDMLFGGSELRPEATGYGLVYFLENMLKHKGEKLEGKRVSITGSGNVAQFAAKKVLELGGNVVSLSDSTGTLICEHIDLDDIKTISKIKSDRKSLSKFENKLLFDYNKKVWSQFHPNVKPWDILESFDIVLPCATQNEIDLKDSKKIVKLGAKFVAEGSNMSTTPDAVDYFKDKDVFYGLGKAANLGGVGVSGLEMSQNAQMEKWDKEKVDERLKLMMKNCFDTCIETSEEYGEKDNLVLGSNIASFLKVTEAMEKQGTVFFK